MGINAAQDLKGTGAVMIKGVPHAPLTEVENMLLDYIKGLETAVLRLEKRLGDESDKKRD